MIELKELRAGYGTSEVLHGVSIAFPPGQVTAIAGPNGCGKSTLLRAVLGMALHGRAGAVRRQARGGAQRP